MIVCTGKCFFGSLSFSAVAQIWSQTVRRLRPGRSSSVSALKLGPAFCLRQGAPLNAVLRTVPVLSVPQWFTQGWTDFVW